MEGLTAPKLRRNHNIKFGNKFFERAEHLKCLGTIHKYKNSIHEEVKSRLTSENDYLSAQNLLSSRLLPKNIKITYVIIVFGLLFFMGLKLDHRSNCGRAIKGPIPKCNKIFFSNGNWRGRVNS